MKRLSLIILFLVSVLHISHAETGEVQMSGLNVKALDSIAVSFYENQDYDQAEHYFLEELQLLENSQKTDIDSECAKIYTFLGDIYSQIGEYNQAYDAISVALDIKLHIYGTRHPEYAVSLSVLGNLLINKGDDYQALPHLQDALQIYTHSFGENNAFCSRLLLFLGTAYLNTGDYITAEEKLLRAIQISKEVEGEPSDGYALVSHALGTLYDCIGDNGSALNYYLQAYKYYIMHYSIRSIHIAMLSSSIGRICTEIGNFELAEQFLGEAVYIEDSIYNGQSVEYARTLSSVAHYYLIRNDYKSALNYYLTAMEIRKSLLGQDNLEYASSLIDIGGALFEMGRYDLAEEYYLSAYLIYKDMSSSYDNSRLTSLFNLGHLYYIQGRYTASEVYVSELFSLYKALYVKSVDFMSARQRQEYWNTMLDLFAYLCPNLTFRYLPIQPSISTLSYNNELFKKGLLLSSSNAVKRSVIESGDTTLIRQWNDLTKKKQQIMVLEEKNSDADYLAQLREEAETLEKEITRSSAAYREDMRQWEITWDSVRAVLKPNQVAIEFMRAPLNEDSTMYCALLLRHDSEYPELIPLFEEKQVTRLLHNSTGDSAKINKTYLYEHNGAELAHLIWDSVKLYIHEGEEIFISPTHLLHQIAIEHLPYDETHTMNEVYSIVRLSSTRELVLPEKPIPHKKATLYGGIEYRALSDEVMAYNNQLYAKRDLSAPQEESQRQLHGYYAGPLKGTQKEVDAIAPILKSQKIAVTIYSDFSACEESVKGLSGMKQNILHFATHGMYVDTLTTNDPLDRCLLTFAGANRALIGNKVPEGMEDGILTAKEISVLDFREADIVVMSACETGLGDVSGEGVFGLQRAFKMAGAQTILMALWRVDDKATQMLMTAFYRYYSKGISKREAFRKAQQEVRSYTETKTVERIIPPTQQEIMANQGKIVAPKTEIKTVTVKPYEAPYFWAGFILLD